MDENKAISSDASDALQPKEDYQLAQKQWHRYLYMRDNGHLEFMGRADRCMKFTWGDQWDIKDVQALRAAKRPALTINKLLSTVSTLLGEQLDTRTEVQFLARNPDHDDIATALNKVYKFIADNNQLDWVRSDVYQSGIITSRGFYEVRIEESENLQGDIRIEMLDPKTVMVDPDATSYDPKDWNDIIITRWMTPDEIADRYGKEDLAKYLKSVQPSDLWFAYDAFADGVDRFGPQHRLGYTVADQARRFRVVDRQYRERRKVLHFVDVKTGDMKPVPADWDAARVSKYLEANQGLSTLRRTANIIMWTVTCDKYVLHHDRSPYDHFTVVPFFPLFVFGRPVGMVENLLDPQQLLNKVSSQELHVVNTTANSGWKVKNGALTNMTIEELAQQGARTGLVLEVTEIDAVEKITPNAYPTGLDRISYKAEEHIKTISNVTDTMLGQDREDVAAKAIEAKQQRGITSHKKPLDNLARSDFFLARTVLSLIQQFMTDERIIRIMKDPVTRETEDMRVNSPQEGGYILNDLTLGKYDVIVAPVPARESLEDSQHEQALELRREGVNIPDDVLIATSRLPDRHEIIQRMNQQANSPEAQQQQQLQMRLQQAEVERTEAEAALKRAEAEAVGVKAHVASQTASLKEAQFQHQQEKDYLAADNAASQTDAQHRRVDLDTAKAQHDMALAEQEQATAAAMQDGQQQAAAGADAAARRAQEINSILARSGFQAPQPAMPDAGETSSTAPNQPQ